MPTWIALFRGINVGGHRKLPMKALARDLESVGCSNVRTYIQSGNAVFRSRSRSAANLSKRISMAVLESHGFRPEVLVISAGQIREAVAGNPFPQAEEHPRSVHLYFLGSPPRDPDCKRLDAARASGEEYVLAGDLLYLHTPEGYGTSKLAQTIERALGVPVTARNWRTVRKVLAMAEELDTGRATS